MSKKKELNKKKIIFLSIAIVIIVAIIITVVLIVKNNNNNDEEIEEVTPVVDEDNTLEKFSIESTSKNRIEKDGIEATDIKFTIIGEQLEVKTTLKNNNKEDLNGYMIEIDLLDASGNVVTTISDNSSDVIKSMQTKEILNYVMDLEDPKQIVSAKITSLEKSSMSNMLEQTFDEMTPNLEGEAAPEGPVQQGPSLQESTEQSQEVVEDVVEEPTE